MEHKGAVISAFTGLLAVGVLTGVFLKNASPYVTVAQAKAAGGEGLHVAGEIVQQSLLPDMAHHQIRFTLRDDKGEVLPVVYTGGPVSNLGNATKVVAIGGMKGGALYSEQLLVKCPSKYEGSKTGS